MHKLVRMGRRDLKSTANDTYNRSLTVLHIWGESWIFVIEDGVRVPIRNVLENDKRVEEWNFRNVDLVDLKSKTGDIAKFNIYNPIDD